MRYLRRDALAVSVLCAKSLELPEPCSTCAHGGEVRSFVNPIQRSGTRVCPCVGSLPSGGSSASRLRPPRSPP
eukprot:SAG11_NODE_33507_length_277_cov_0.573034_1_plen_72_part_10